MYIFILKKGEFDNWTEPENWPGQDFLSFTTMFKTNILNDWIWIF